MATCPSSISVAHAQRECVTISDKMGYCESLFVDCDIKVLDAFICGICRLVTGPRPVVSISTVYQQILTNFIGYRLWPLVLRRLPQRMDVAHPDLSH